MKLIDCKVKEIYYNLPPIKEDTETENSREIFWVSMNMMGITNGFKIQNRHIIP